jgi:hypothetical protein
MPRPLAAGQFISKQDSKPKLQVAIRFNRDNRAFQFRSIGFTGNRGIQVIADIAVFLRIAHLTFIIPSSILNMEIKPS